MIRSHLLLMMMVCFSFFDASHFSYLMDVSVISEDDNEDDVRLVPNSADDAPRNTNSMQSTVGSSAASVPSRPVGRVVGIIKRNWNS